MENTEYAQQKRHDISTLTFRAFGEALKGSSGQEVFQDTVAALRRVQRDGQGLTLEQLPTPMRQNANECQGALFINGITAYVPNAMLPEVSSIRRDASILRNQTGVDVGTTTQDAFANMTDYAMLLGPQRLNLLREIFPRDNLVDVAQNLFRDSRFMGVTEGDYHAWALVPLQYSPTTPEAFAVKIDSLGGIKTVISVGKFIDTIMQRIESHNNMQSIYEVKKENVPVKNKNQAPQTEGNEQTLKGVVSEEEIDAFNRWSYTVMPYLMPDGAIPSGQNRQAQYSKMQRELWKQFRDYKTHVKFGELTVQQAKLATVASAWKIHHQNGTSLLDGTSILPGLIRQYNTLLGYEQYLATDGEKFEEEMKNVLNKYTPKDKE